MKSTLQVIASMEKNHDIKPLFIKRTSLNSTYQCMLKKINSIISVFIVTRTALKSEIKLYKSENYIFLITASLLGDLHLRRKSRTDEAII